MGAFKSNLSSYSLYYAKACYEFAGLSSLLLLPGNTAPFREMLQQWRAIGNTASDLTSSRFEPQTSCFRDEHVAPRPTDWVLLTSNFFQMTISNALSLHENHSQHSLLNQMMMLTMW